MGFSDDLARIPMGRISSRLHFDQFSSTEFEIKGQPENYIVPNSSYLYSKVKVITTDDTNPGADARAAPVNNWMHSLFSEVDLYLNNKLVSSSMETYPYRWYIENLLTYGKEAKNTHMDVCVLWKPDTASDDKFNDTALTEDNNPHNVVFNDRRKKILQGRVLELLDRLHLDIWFQEKNLLNVADIRLSLNRSRTAFHMMAHAIEYKIIIQEARFYVCRVEVLPKVENDISHTLSRTTAKYQIPRVEVKTFTVATGLRSKIKVICSRDSYPNI